MMLVKGQTEEVNIQEAKDREGLDQIKKQIGMVNRRMKCKNFL